jgi:hypothetical protein
LRREGVTLQPHPADGRRKLVKDIPESEKPYHGPFPPSAPADERVVEALVREPMGWTGEGRYGFSPTAALSGSGAGGCRQEQLDAMLAAIAKVEQRTGKVYVLDPNKLADFLAAAPTATGGR